MDQRGAVLLSRLWPWARPPAGPSVLLADREPRPGTLPLDLEARATALLPDLEARAAPVTHPPEATIPVAAKDPLDIWAIEESLRSLTAGAQKCAGDFYGYLFAANPGLREMFPPVMNRQNERLFAALVKITGLLGSPDRLSRYLTQLGTDHRKYGVLPEHYAPVGEALIRALRRHCEHWDDRAEAAWQGAYAAASGLMIGGAETSSGPPWWRGRVIRHQMLTPDLAVIDLRTSQPLPYEPGQYITVQHPKWPRVWRQFSVASAPEPGWDYLQLHVRRVPGGWVSTALTKDTVVPDELVIGPPVGTMTAEAANGSDLLLVAGGVGLAPMKALAEDILTRDEQAMAGGWGHRRNICLFHGARTALDLYAMPELHELERAYPWFQVVPVVSDEPGFRGDRGRVTDVMLEQDWPGRHAYLAGPPDMICTAVAGLRAAGLDEDQVHYDDPGSS